MTQVCGRQGAACRERAAGAGLLRRGQSSAKAACPKQPSGQGGLHERLAVEVLELPAVNRVVVGEV